MYRCRSQKHVWTQKQDAAKCCNGYQRMLLVGATALQTEPPQPESGTWTGRAWGRSPAAEHDARFEPQRESR